MAKLAPTWVQKSITNGVPKSARGDKNRVPHRAAVTEQSWACLESILGALLGGTWTVLGSSWGVSGPSWGRVGASCSVMWASWGSLESILWQIFNPKWLNFKHVILDTIVQSIFGWFCLRKPIPESWKNNNLYWNNNIYLLSGYFNMKSLLDVSWGSTWLHFGFQNPSKSCLGGVLGPLGLLLGRRGGILAAPWSRLGVSWAVLDSSGFKWCKSEEYGILWGPPADALKRGRAPGTPKWRISKKPTP